MLNPEKDIETYFLIKAISIYEEYKKKKSKCLSEDAMKKMLKNKLFISAGEYYECVCALYALGMIDEKEGEVRFIQNENN
jgi:hypothetical protein